MSPPTPRQLARNIRRTLAFSFLQVFMVLMPVIVLFFESRGLRLSEVLLLQAWFAGLVLVLEVPSGYLADLLGRKRTLVVGTCSVASGTSSCCSRTAYGSSRSSRRAWPSRSA